MQRKMRSDGSPEPPTRFHRNRTRGGADRLLAPLLLLSLLAFVTLWVQRTAPASSRGPLTIAEDGVAKATPEPPAPAGSPVAPRPGATRAPAESATPRDERRAPGLPGADAAPPAEPPLDPASATVTIVTRDAGTGEPLPGARVEVRLVAEDAGPLEAPRVLVRTSDAAGRVALRVAPGYVSAVAWTDERAGGPTGAALVGGGHEPLEVLLERVHAVAGRVVDSASGEPVAGATVRFWTFSERDAVGTAADGTFRHPRFPRSEFAEQVRVEAPGYGPAVRYLEIDEHGRWELPAAFEGHEPHTGDGVPWVEVALVRELRVEGRVVDPEGEPIAGAEVHAEGFFAVLPSVGARDAAAATADGRGRFLLEGLRSDVGHGVTLRAEGFAARTLEVPADATGYAALGRIVLEREVVVAGVVLDPAGTPVEDIEVALRRRHVVDDPAEEGEATPSGIDTGARVEGEAQLVRTDATGTFVLDGLAPGEYELVVARDDGVILEHELSLSGWHAVGDLRLVLPAESLTLVGEVRDEDGAVAGAEVLVRRFGLVGRVTTDAQGRFRVAGLDDQEAYELEVQAPCPTTGTVRVARAESWGHGNPVLRLGRR